ncbi:MAG TPA: hypothetical protein VMS17_23120 [Gemmataceae bacterium]|nr:hypothetical protein [Gemmataceae bacterium]
MHAEISFRDVRCPDLRADKGSEAVAVAWKWFRRLAERGRDAADFPAAFATYAARAVRCGRRLCGQEKAKDVLSSAAQRRRGFRLESLPSSTRVPFDDLCARPHGQDLRDAFEERLRDNRFAPPPAAAFRIDFPDFVAGLPQRDRQMALFLSLGNAASDAAARFRLSPGRVTQLRQRCRREWLLCQGNVHDAGERLPENESLPC